MEPRLNRQSSVVTVSHNLSHSDHTHTRTHTSVYIPLMLGTQAPVYATREHGPCWQKASTMLLPTRPMDTGAGSVYTARVDGPSTFWTARKRAVEVAVCTGSEDTAPVSTGRV